MKRPAGLTAQQLSLAFDAEPAPLAAPRSRSRIQRTREHHELVLPHGALRFRLRRARRRTIGLQIDDGGLTVSAPRWVRLADIEAAILEKERWIRAKLAEWERWRTRRRLPVLVLADGGRLPYLGGELVLRLGRATATTQRVGDELWLALPADASEQQIRDAVQSWLQAEARRVLGERLALLAQGAEIKPRGWALSSARSQWGCCTHDGRIRLNWRLVHFALPVIDYVVAHELAHLREMNHGPRFWSVVAQLLPGFETARDTIRDVPIDALPI
ncbi:MAG: SprT family zinc-dependent metalloprotease [Sutterellaceae bacterium]|nr:M48 family metallopeptidase [Burkholderiaceae bacterium]MDW8429895.1 SprT family zinc-dependent metalloprotease [Sutterellaceae bacterium]